MSNTILMQELRRLADVDWIRNELSAPIGMLNMLALEEGEQSAQTVLANDQEAREIIFKPFKAFAEKYKGAMDPQMHGGTCSAGQMLADPEGKKLIEHLEQELKRIHEYLVRLEQDPRTNAFSEAENFVSTKLHELVHYARESTETKPESELIDEQERQKLETLIDASYEEGRGISKK